MISYEEALAIITGNVQPLPPETVTIGQCLSRISAGAVKSPIIVPPFANSAMDGFAIRTLSTLQASQDNPVIFPVSHSLAAGDALSCPKDGQAIEIMTGAAVPEGFDAVIPVEDVNVSYNESGLPEEITLSRLAKPNENIRHAGEDFARGAFLLDGGTKITPRHIMALAATGTGTIKVRRMPRVIIISTGREISDNYDELLTGSHIYNSNTPYLLAELADAGISAHYAGIVQDNAHEFMRMIENLNSPDIVITTGAVSKGRWDFIPQALKNMNADILFHKVNIRPGKPILFARLRNGAYFFGLPGNPVSTAVGLKFFVVPLLFALLGMKKEIPLKAQFQGNFTKKGSFRQFLKGCIGLSKDGRLVADILPGQESFKISPLLSANAWIVAGEGDKGLYDGAEISAHFIDLLGDGLNNIRETVERDLCKTA